MAQPFIKSDSKKRKHTDESNAVPSKHRQTAGPRPRTLIGPHQAILAELAPKYDVLPASIISSSKIRQRTVAITTHLLATSKEDTKLPRVVLLHARIDCLSKLLTVVETVKRVLGQEGRVWWQYNQLFHQPERKEDNKKDKIDETVLERKNADDSRAGDDEDYFETMGSRLEQAICPEPKARTVKSLRVLLAVDPVPELKSKSGVTLQTSSSSI